MMPSGPTAPTMKQSQRGDDQEQLSNREVLHWVAVVQGKKKRYLGKTEGTVFSNTVS